MFKKIFFQHDWLITVMMFLILTIGIVTIFSTSVGQTQTLDTFQRQLIFAITGVFLYFLVSIMDYSYLKYKPFIVILYSLDILLLAFDFIAGHAVRGAVRWLNFGILNFQPSELTKVVIILTLSSFLASSSYKSPSEFLRSISLLIPLALFVLIEPSLSATIVILFIWACIYFMHAKEQSTLLLIICLILLALNIGGAFYMPKIFFFPLIRSVSSGLTIISLLMILLIYISKHVSLKTILLVFCIGILIGAGGRYVVWNKVLQPYQRARITAFASPNQQTSTNPGVFQVNQSKIAIGSGEIFGKGFAEGTQSKLNFLPDHNTDFIFASFSEEFGLLGDGLLLLLFGVLYYRLMVIAEKTKDPFAFLVMCGIIALLLFQTFVNIAINVGMLPSTGIPMPLVSYGGSSLWIIFILLGLTQSIYRQTNSKKWLNIDM